MKIILTRNVVISGADYEAGETVDVSDEVGVRLINMGKAQPAADKPKGKDRAVGLTKKSAASLVKRVKGKK